MVAGREAQEGGDTCIHMAGTCHCTPETNTILSTNYTPIKKIISNRTAWQFRGRRVFSCSGLEKLHERGICKT